MNLANFSQWLTNISLNALYRLNRQIVILQGSNQWANLLLQQIETYPLHESSSLVSSQAKTWYVYSDSTTLQGNVNKQTYRNKLGTESDFVVFYSDEINIDALAALSGTLVSGGVLFFVLPTNINASTFVNQSYFNTRLVEKLFNQPNIKLLSEYDDFLEITTENNSDQPQSNTFKEVFEMGCLTLEQLTAVQKIIQVVKGHRNRPLVLTADRGRGKSSALAIACAHLLANSTTNIKIAITATHRKSLTVFFKQLATNVIQNEICESTITGNVFEHKSGSVEFIAVDKLIDNKDTFHLVIVDEAASIPLYLLNQLLEQYHRMVFATTVHGYEGAGRSFALKFQENLARKYPEYKILKIRQPIRWAENDPLENFIYDLCLLNAELPHIQKVTGKSKVENNIEGNVESKAYHFTAVTAEELSLNEALLKQVFAVLVTAHYQTSPNDLQLLLDNKNITVVILCYQDQVAGVALLIKEGKVDKQGVELVKNNKRRLKDQFIPQSLLSHCGEESSFSYSYLRVMRIAIIPELQGQGKGTLFLSYIEQYAKQHTIDFVGTSFGVNQQLLNFWQLQKYKIARVGFTKDKASGEHSALLIKPMNKEHEAFTQLIEQAFYQSFDYLLAEQYKALSPELVWQVMTYCPKKALPEITDVDLKTVKDFYTKKRQYSACVYSLHKWLQHQMKKPFDTTMAPIISKVFQRNEITYLVSKYEFTGKKSFNSHLIQFTQKYFEQ